MRSVSMTRSTAQRSLVPDCRTSAVVLIFLLTTTAIVLLRETQVGASTWARWIAAKPETTHSPEGYSRKSRAMLVDAGICNMARRV